MEPKRCTSNWFCFCSTYCKRCEESWIELARDTPAEVVELIMPPFEPHTNTCRASKSCLLEGCLECRSQMHRYLQGLGAKGYEMHQLVLQRMTVNPSAYDEGQDVCQRYTRWRERTPQFSHEPPPFFYDKEGNLIFCGRCGNTSGAQCNCYV
jgi:hypothetical protein